MLPFLRTKAADHMECLLLFCTGFLPIGDGVVTKRHALYGIQPISLRVERVDADFGAVDHKDPVMFGHKTGNVDLGGCFAIEQNVTIEVQFDGVPNRLFDALASLRDVFRYLQFCRHTIVQILQRLVSKVLENLLDVHLGFEEDALLRNLARVLILELAGDFVIAANQSVLKHCTIFIASGVSQVPPNLLPIT